jgi:aryl-alcohol dehydrogenase-like predicted oxidoreductase
VIRLDLVQMYWWDYEIYGMIDITNLLADLKEKGLITNVSTSNMSSEVLAQIIKSEIPIVCNQVLIDFIEHLDCILWQSS